MKRVFSVALGILTAFGGFVDIGDLVANSLVGARFGLSLTWVLLIAVLGICLFAEMSGRIAAVSHRPVFDLVRERLGPRAALANLGASFLITLLTLAAELGGTALVLQLVTGVGYLVFIPAIMLTAWLVIWRMRFSLMENVFALGGLALIAFAVALWALNPDWTELAHQATHPSVPGQDGLPTYLYYAIALFGGAMTPYEVFFFSSGGVEERWSRRDLLTSRMNVFVGFPLGGILSLAIAACAAVVFYPVGVEVDSLGQVVLPGVLGLGKIGFAFIVLGIFAATFGATLETALSCGYTIAQFFGWQWGKFVAPIRAARFHTVVLLSLVVAAMGILTTVDPIKVTEYSIVFSAIGLPLTYLPVLIVANDRQFMGDRANGRISNTLGSVYMVILLLASVAAIPLMLATKAGE